MNTANKVLIFADAVNYYAVAPTSPVGEGVAWGEDTWPQGGACGRAPPTLR